MKRFSQLSPASKALVIPFYARAMGYKSTVTDPITLAVSPNPETMAQFAARLTDEHIVREAINRRATEQSLAAVAALSGPTDADL